MKVFVLSTKMPFAHGEADEIYDHLLRNLKSAGVEAEGIRLPFISEPSQRLIEDISIAGRIRLANLDRVIALKFPAYIVPWHNKVIWLLHHHRQAYDLPGLGENDRPADAQAADIMSAVRSADQQAFSDARRVLSASPGAAARLRHFFSIESSLLRAPLNDSELFTGGDSGGYIVATGPVNATNRQHLLVQALRYAPSARLIVAGAPDSAADAQALSQIAAEADVADRVQLELRSLSRNELATLVNGSSAVAHVPLDDAYGYRAMEAHYAGKPLITASDSEGVAGFVRNGETAYVVDPNPEAIGQAMEAACADNALAERLGLAGRAALLAENISWPAVIEQLLA